MHTFKKAPCTVALKLFAFITTNWFDKIHVFLLPFHLVMNLQLYCACDLGQIVTVIRANVSLSPISKKSLIKDQAWLPQWVLTPKYTDILFIHKLGGM